MSRIANMPISLPNGVEVGLNGRSVSIKGSKGTMDFTVADQIEVVNEDSSLKVRAKGSSKFAKAMSGTTRALLQNMVIGVTEGFERKLNLVGVGYRAQASGNSLNLTLGFSHPVVYDIPEGISIETPSQTEIVIRGIDKQRVGQVSAEIRAFRPPEPYKGKGVKYADEIIRRKESKKK